MDCTPQSWVPGYLAELCMAVPYGARAPLLCFYQSILESEEGCAAPIEYCIKHG